MQAVILAAGKSTRTYPLTVNMPKSLLPLCNKPIIQYLLDDLQDLVDEVILVVGFGADQIKAFVGDQWGKVKVTYVEQEEQLGTGHALMICEDLLKDKFFFVYGDIVYPKEALNALADKGMGMLVREVENPRQFGVIEEENGIATALVEKPEHPKTNLANVGCYLLSTKVFEHELQMTSRNEYEATDYVSYLIEQGEQVHVIPVDYWLHIGYPWDVLDAQDFLMSESYIDPTAEIHEEAYLDHPVVIGKNVKIGAHAWIGKSVINDDCVIGEYTKICHSCLDMGCTIGQADTIEHSILGKGIVLDDNVHVLHNHEEEETVKAEVKGQEVDTKRTSFGCALGDEVRVETGVIVKPGELVWPEEEISKK